MSTPHRDADAGPRWYQTIAGLAGRLVGTVEETRTRLELRSLRPHFDRQHHQIYVDALVQELKRRDPARNIAVSGPYGSGKSSVLLEVRRRRKRHGVVEIALSTLDESTQPIASAAAITSQTSIATEALQKEIVKRLLYSARPSRLPRSQLNRIRSLGPLRTVAIAALGAVIIGGLAWAYQLNTPFIALATAIQGSTDWVREGIATPVARVLDASVIFLLFISVQWLLSHVRLREVAVGEFKLSREDPAQNYFDQYLDEIVYFFSRTRVRLVVFEDLDRFAETGIFVALRELNVLLNNSRSITQPVTFIYAIRDSVFATRAVDGEQSKVGKAATDRAKFFDLIIPIVPFVSMEVSAALLAEELKSLDQSAQPDSSLVRLAGRYFQDMRAIRSIRNEYEVYFDRLIRNGTIDLDRDQLFAMVLYKHAFPDDVEQIQFGSSRIDSFLAALDQGVTDRLSGLDREIEAEESRLNSATELAARAVEAGMRLETLLDLFVQGTGRRNQVAQVVVDSIGFPKDAIRSTEFWAHLDTHALADLHVELANGTVHVVQRSALTAALPQDLPASAWLTSAATVSRDRLTRLVNLRKELQHANVRERVADQRFMGPGGHAEAEWEVDLSEIARRELGSTFALELVRAGLLDRSFHLYTSVYFDALVSSAAQTFRVQNVAARRSSPLAPLSPSDVDEIRAKVGDSFLEEPSALNLAVFDRLLESGALDNTIAMIATDEIDGSREFAALYLARGGDAEKFATKLASNAAWALSLIADAYELPATRKRALFDAALLGANPDIDYQVGDQVQQLLADVGDSSLRRNGPRLRGRPARAVASLLAEGRIQISDISRLSRDARIAIAESGAFRITVRNLAAIAEARGRVGLDSIGQARPAALRHILSRLPEYLDEIDLNRRASIDGTGDLFELLSLAAEYGPTAVEALLSRATAEVTIANLPGDPDDIPLAMQSSYPALARASAFDPSAANIVAYLSVVGGLDTALDGYLSRRSPISGLEGIGEAERQAIAGALMATLEMPPEQVVLMLGMAELREHILSNLHSIERPEVARAILDARLVAVDPSTLTELLAAPWIVFEAAISMSPEAGLLLPDLPLTSDAVDGVLTSRRLTDEVKWSVVQNGYSLRLLASAEAATEALRIARGFGHVVPASQLIELVHKGARHRELIAYLGAQANEYRDVELVELLNTVGGEWAAIASKTKVWTLVETSEGIESVLSRLVDVGAIRSYARARNGRMRVTIRTE